jgi:hypothetical protein
MLAPSETRSPVTELEGPLVRRSLRLAVFACLVTAAALPLLAAPDANAAVVTKAVNYGPFTIPAGSGDPHDHMAMGAMSNKVLTNVAKPCSNCTIVAARPDLVYADGRSANLDSGPMLHHTVFSAKGSGKVDSTCAGTQLGSLGERFFASGNERTPFDVKSVPYGYKVGKSDTWNMVVDLMNWQTSPKTVSVRVTYVYATGADATARKALRPVWLDVGPCGSSEIAVPNGSSETNADWSVNVPGKVIAAGGHVHDHGVYVEATNETRGGASICKSVAGYGESPGYVTPDGRKHVSSMSMCLDDPPVTTLSSGEIVRLHAVYNVPGDHPLLRDLSAALAEPAEIVPIPGDWRRLA